MDIDVTNTTDIELSNENVNNSIKDDKEQRKENENTIYQTPIILIDDEPDLLLTFDIILKNEGYKICKNIF